MNSFKYVMLCQGTTPMPKIWVLYVQDWPLLAHHALRFSRLHRLALQVNATSLPSDSHQAAKLYASGYCRETGLCEYQ
jgi:hypothetical protein